MKTMFFLIGVLALVGLFLASCKFNYSPVNLRIKNEIDLASLINAMLMFFLILITLWYAKSTKEMCDVMAKEFSLTTVPYLSLERDIVKLVKTDKGNSNKLAEKTDWLSIRFTIRNVGRVPLKWKVDVASFNGVVPKVDYPELILYPDLTLFFTTERFTIPEVKPDELVGEGEIKIIYWSLDLPERKYFLKRKYKSVGSNYLILEDDAGPLKEG